MKLLSGITSNAEKFGYLAAVMTAGGNGIDAIVSSIQQLMAGVIHAPDMSRIQSWANSEGKNALMLYIGGLALDAVPIGVAKKFSKPLQKGAMGYAMGTLAIQIFYGMTHSQIKGVNVENTPGASSFMRQAPAITNSPYHY